MESAFTQQPAQLPDPVPSEGAQPNNPFKAALESAPKGQINLDAPETQETQETNPFKAALGQTAPQSPTPMQGEFPMETAEEAPTGMASLSEQVREMGTRLRNSFTVTPKESLQVLKESGRFSDVKINKDGDLLVKRQGSEKYSKFDRDSFEVLGDLLDAGRMVTEGVYENAMKIPAVAASVVGSGGITAPIASGASAVAALNIGDVIAEGALQITKRRPDSR